MSSPISLWYIALMIAVMMLVTWGLRALPFFFKDSLNEHPFIAFIQNRFPLIMMLILVVYASEVYKAQHLSEVQFSLIGIGSTAVLQLFFKNYLLSLFAGIAVYVALVNGLI